MLAHKIRIFGLLACADTGNDQRDLVRGCWATYPENMEEIGPVVIANELQTLLDAELMGGGGVGDTIKSIEPVCY